MATPAQKAFADALRALAGIIESGGTVEAAAEAKPAEPAPAPKKKPANAPVNTTPVAEVPAPAPAKKEEPKAAAAPAATNGATDLMADARKAAKAYAGTFGREGLKEILTKYTEGTLADVPPEKMPELLKELS